MSGPDTPAGDGDGDGDTPTDQLQVHIENTDVEFDVLATIQVENEPENTAAATGHTVLGLTTGGPELVVPDDGPMAIMGAAEHNAQAIVFADRGRALGYYLHGLESHGVGVSEADVLASLTEYGVDMSAYHDMQASLSLSDRRLRLLDFWEWRMEHGDFAAEVYADDATWRTTGLSESARKLAERIATESDRAGTRSPRMCYKTAGEAAIRHVANHRVEYVEGIALPHQAGQAIRHAWLEIDGAVAELTWPWHHPDPGEHDAVYWGVPVEKARVKETRERRDVNGAVLLDDAQIARVTGAMRTDVDHAAAGERGDAQ